MSRLFLTDRHAFFLNACLSSRHILAASTFAGDSVLGSASMDMTLSRIFSMLCTGDHRSLLDSYPSGSLPGGCRMLY